MVSGIGVKMMLWEEIAEWISDDHDVHSFEIIESNMPVVKFQYCLGFRIIELRPSLKTLS